MWLISKDVQIKTLTLIGYVCLSINISFAQSMINFKQNNLDKEFSPYLKQHSENPVWWQAWSQAVLNEAQLQDKLLIISIGYSTCHWCHVMERESFEDQEVADLMNAHFIAVKVDREELPHVDQLYMNAVQLMTGRGGWPLNVVALPDGRPVWAGTYFPKMQWMQSLEQLIKIKNKQPRKLIEYADKLAEGIVAMEQFPGDANTQLEFPMDKTIKKWSSNFDKKWGGFGNAPKFMMPSALNFLLQQAHLTKDNQLLDFVENTLDQMALGGIFDQVSGGFARYSTDEQWHIPHFEKMLYDNAQLMQVYSKAYLQFQKPLYKAIVSKTADFMLAEMKDSSGLFYAALDADSDNEFGVAEEGAYYVFTEEDFKKQDLFNDDLFKAYFGINKFSYWENNQYVLRLKQTDEVFIAENNLSAEIFEGLKTTWMNALKSIRQEKSRPHTDKKFITEWNALSISGFCEAYRITQNKSYKEAAIKAAQEIWLAYEQNNKSLPRILKQSKVIPGYASDYVQFTQALLAVFQMTDEVSWLRKALEMHQQSTDLFYDNKAKKVYLTSELQNHLIARPVDYRDNVITSSAAQFAHNAFLIGLLTENDAYSQTAQVLLQKTLPEAKDYPIMFAHWLSLWHRFKNPFYEVVITGPNAYAFKQQLMKTYMPNAVFLASDKASDLPAFEQRFVPEETYIYVCLDKVCKLPVQTPEEALKLMRE